MILPNPSGFREAPPTSAPSMLGQPEEPRCVFAALTLPPYRMRVASCHGAGGLPRPSACGWPRAPLRPELGWPPCPSRWPTRAHRQSRCARSWPARDRQRHRSGGTAPLPASCSPHAPRGRLADAGDGAEVGRQRCRTILSLMKPSGFGEVLTSFAVAEDDPPAPAALSMGPLTSPVNAPLSFGYRGFWPATSDLAAERSQFSSDSAPGRAPAGSRPHRAPCRPQWRGRLRPAKTRRRRLRSSSSCRRSADACVHVPSPRRASSPGSLDIAKEGKSGFTAVCQVSRCRLVASLATLRAAVTVSSPTTPVKASARASASVSARCRRHKFPPGEVRVCRTRSPGLRARFLAPVHAGLQVRCRAPGVLRDVPGAGHASARSSERLSAVSTSTCVIRARAELLGQRACTC